METKKINDQWVRLYFVEISRQISTHSIHAEMHWDSKIRVQGKSYCIVPISSVVGFHSFMN